MIEKPNSPNLLHGPGLPDGARSQGGKGEVCPATTQPGPMHPPAALPNTHKVPALPRGDTGLQLASMEGSQAAKVGQGQRTARPPCPRPPAPTPALVQQRPGIEQQGSVKRTHAHESSQERMRWKRVQGQYMQDSLLPSFGGCGRKHASPGHRGVAPLCLKRQQRAHRSTLRSQR